MCQHRFPAELTRTLRVFSSLILFPLRFRYVRLGHFSASVSKPPAMMLSLTSNCDTQMRQTHGTGRQSRGTGSRRGLLTLRSLGREGSLASDFRPTLTMLRTSSSVYSSVRPSTSPSPDWQLSTNRSTTYQHTKGPRCQQQTVRGNSLHLSGSRG